jgi:hypothetical protein
MAATSTYGETVNPLLLVLVLASSMLAGCDAIVGIFEAGAWVGIVLALVIVAVVAWLFSMFRRK